MRPVRTAGRPGVEAVAAAAGLTSWGRSAPMAWRSLGKDEGPDASGEGNAMMVNGLGHLGVMARGGAQAV